MGHFYMLLPLLPLAPALPRLSLRRAPPCSRCQVDRIRRSRVPPHRGVGRAGEVRARSSAAAAAAERMVAERGWASRQAGWRSGQAKRTDGRVRRRGEGADGSEDGGRGARRTASSFFATVAIVAPLSRGRGGPRYSLVY